MSDKAATRKRTWWTNVYTAGIEVKLLFWVAWKYRSLVISYTLSKYKMLKSDNNNFWTRVWHMQTQCNSTKRWPENKVVEEKRLHLASCPFPPPFTITFCCYRVSSLSTACCSCKLAVTLLPLRYKILNHFSTHCIPQSSHLWSVAELAAIAYLARDILPCPMAPKTKPTLKSTTCCTAAWSCCCCTLALMSFRRNVFSFTFTFTQSTAWERFDPKPSSGILVLICSKSFVCSHILRSSSLIWWANDEIMLVWMWSLSSCEFRLIAGWTMGSQIYALRAFHCPRCCSWHVVWRSTFQGCWLERKSTASTRLARGPPDCITGQEVKLLKC